MKRLFILGIAILLFLSTPAFADQIVLTADLEPGNEVPAVQSPGTGVAAIALDANGTLVYSVFSVGFGASPNNIIAAHIHRGSQSENGPIFKALAVDATGNGSGTIQLTPAELAQFVSRPFYVNLHTEAFPPGAIRGQISFNSGRALRFTADLSGSSEVPATGTTAQGSAFVYLNPDSNKLAYRVDSTGFGMAPNAIVAAHIHGGGAKTNGPILFPLSLDTMGNGMGIEIITDDVKAALLKNELYVNLHTAEFPPGAIRGQLEADLGPSSQRVYTRNILSGTQSIAIDRGPSILDTDALANGDVFELVSRALAAGAPQVTVIAAFDPAEAPTVPPQVVIVTQTVTINTEDEFFIQPGIVSDAAALPSGVSQADFRNFFFRNYAVSFNSVDVNQLATIPSLFGPVIVGGPQLGGPADLPSLSITAYNTTFMIRTAGDHLVGVQWKTYKTLTGGGPSGGDLPAAEVRIVVPVTVTQRPPTTPYMQTSRRAQSLSGLFQSQRELSELIQQALAEYTGSGKDSSSRRQ